MEITLRSRAPNPAGGLAASRSEPFCRQGLVRAGFGPGPGSYPRTAAMNRWYFRWPKSRQMIRIGGAARSPRSGDTTGTR